MKYAHNYIGTQIRAEKAGRTFLGDVIDAYMVENKINLVVRHFNGEPWPFDPRADDVDILGRNPA